MHKKLNVIGDCLPTPGELAAIDRTWLEEVQRRSAEFDAGRMKSFPAEEVFERVRSRLAEVQALIARRKKSIET